MKETAVNINYFVMANEDKVRPAGKVGLVKAVSETHSMNDGTNYLLWLGVATFDSRHVEASLLRCKNVSHCVSAKPNLECKEMT
jgi:hypothetical protein